jgi:CheY-like chemotaxis protein
MTNSIKRVIAVMEDLMFMVKIQETAKRAGLETVAVKTKELALAKAAEQPLLIVIDLNYAAAVPLELIQALKADAATKDIPLLAFVSHVQTELRTAAVTAGCDTVIPRSAFAQKLPEVIQALT